jgi:hypothetical protein
MAILFVLLDYCDNSCGFFNLDSKGTSDRRQTNILIILNLLLETLVVIRDLGVQLETKYYSGKQTHLFIEKRIIKSIIINEGIKSYNFLFYMAFIVEGNSRMILAFNVSSILPLSD